MANTHTDKLSRVDLARASDFGLDRALVRPSVLEIRLGETIEFVEPRVMQLLVALHRAAGAPVSRDDLIAGCWNGLAISDDAITQCVSKLRRSLAALPGVQITSVPRVGYRIVCKPAEGAVSSDIATRPALLGTGPRRIAAAIFVLVGASGLSLDAKSAGAADDEAAPTVVSRSVPQNQEADQLHAAAVKIFRERTRAGYAESERLLRRAVALDPANASSWARLAMAVYAPYWWASQDDPSARARLYSEALGYARRALSLDPNLGEAHQAMAFVLWYKNPLPWIERAAQLDPDNGEIRYQLAEVLERQLQLRRALDEAERALELEPTTPRVIETTAFLRLRLGHRAEAYALIDRLARLTNRGNEQRTDRFEISFFEGRLADAAAQCAQSLARGDEESWWAEASLIQIATKLQNHELRSRLLEKNPKLIAVVAFEDPRHSLRLARSAPNDWWEDLFIGALARQLLNAGAADLLLSLYDDRYQSVQDFWKGEEGNADTLAPPLVVAMRQAGRAAEASEMRDRFAADIATLGAEGDRSARVPVGRAQLAALDGHADLAAYWLDVAIAGGWKAQGSRLGFGPDHDPVFATIRDDPAIQRSIGHFHVSLANEAAALDRLNLGQFFPKRRAS